MSKKNETIILICTLGITFGLLGLGLWGLITQLDQILKKYLPNNPNSVQISATTQEKPSPASPNLDGVSGRLSFGEKFLIISENNSNKETAIRAFGTKNYQKAVEALEASLQIKKNDPESLIYLNNARIGNQKSYTIAVSVPIGNDVNASQEILRGVAQAQEEINAVGGIKGVPLKVLIANDDNDPEIAKQLAQVFINNGEILGVVGHFGSGTTLAPAKEVYQPQGLVMISPTSTSVELSGIGKYIFRTVPSDRFAGEALAKYMLSSMKKQKAAVFFNSKSSYSKSLKDVFTTTIFSSGGEILTEIDLVDPNFNAVKAIQLVKEQGAEVIMLAMNTETLEQALWVIQANEGQLSLLGGDSAYKPEILKHGRKNALGMVLAVPWHILGNPGAKFPQQAQQLWGGDVNWRTAMAYDATKALIAAMEVNPTREGIQQTLSTSGFSTLGAGRDIRFLPSGDRNQPIQLVKVEPGERSPYGYDFVPIQ